VKREDEKKKNESVFHHLKYPNFLVWYGSKGNLNGKNGTLCVV